ncbi:hypothetical protein G6N82_11680 [Altererythrobacter sp. BO-6]|uniref:hypothetical protein n=1 Tax=Altererythrobacter sp. BO-6 TaxID=2604537 RepID=UPI0013E1D20D|nr:hypothetical protein [Altererythrobacter sp. BO-6]QIG54725.1 hypothetical protein G6N82_11680 [Altererythrobacter sp. BO-6]
MNLDFDVQLQVALRALTDVVAPALGEGAEKHVVEQLHLAVATISFVKTRLPEARRYYRMELRHFIDLAEAAARMTGEDAALDAAVRDGEAALRDAEADIGNYIEITRRLREEVAALASRTEGEDRAALDRLVLDTSGELLAQYRQWALPFGLEPKPEELPAPAW